jgi:hypothetical protein
MTKRILFYIFTYAKLTSIYAQTEVSNSYFLNFGLAIPSTKETHYTSNFRNGIGYNVQIGYERQSSKSINRFSVLFLQSKQGKENLSFSNILRPEIRYEHLRKINESGLSIGGYFDIGTLLNFRRGTWADENSINYTMWSSFGFSSQYEKSIKLKDKKINWNSKFSVPLMTYLIRPSYTFPYTDNYLENGVFSFDRSGLSKKIVTGGKLVSLDKFLNIGFQTGFSFPTNNNKWELGVNYSLNYMQTNELKPIFQSVHLINLTTKFLK